MILADEARRRRDRVGQGRLWQAKASNCHQNERLTGRIDSVSVCLMTSDLSNESLLRVTIEPEQGNGLRARSQVQIEKIMTFPSEKVRGPVGRISGDRLYEIDRGLMFHLDLVQPFEVTRTT
jgi:mRNA-degrading endonuclease toxin of MazEF toxin-antitoxin module